MKKQQIPRENKPTVQLWCVFLVGLILFITLIPLVSALDFDNSKSYDAKTKTATITNFFGLGDELAKVTLIDNTDYCLMNCEATIKLELLKSYSNPLNKIDFLNVKYGNYRMDLQNEILISSDAKKYDSYDKNKKLSAGTYYIKIKAQKNPRETIEWIPTDFMGIEINEWATWTGSFDVGLMAYYNFSSTQGQSNVVPNGYYDLVNITSNPTFLDNANYCKSGFGACGNLSRVIAGAGAWNISNSAIDFAFLPQTNVTISFWLNVTDISGLDRVMSKEGGIGSAGWEIAVEDTATDEVMIRFYNFGGGGGDFLKSGQNFTRGRWVHIVMIMNDTTAQLWQNGTMVNWTRNGTITAFPSRGITLGGDDGGEEYNGFIDELAFWNRSLSTAEILDLWDSGTGTIRDSYAGSQEVVVNLNSPTDAVTYLKGQAILFNATIIPHNINLTNGTLFIWDASSTQINKTINHFAVTTNYTSETLFNVSNLNNGNYIWNVYGCGVNDTYWDFCDWDTNRTFTISLFNITSYQFNTSAYETESKSFYVNLTLESAVTSLSAVLNYNGTSYAADSSCSGNNCTVSTTIDVPLITSAGKLSENKTFYWGITVFDGVSLSSSYSNTSVNGQNVSFINFTRCTASPVVNFSIYNETDLNPMVASFDAGFDYYLGSGTVVKEGSFASTTDLHSYEFCTNPNMTFITTSQIDLSATGFASRSYDFVKRQYTNLTTTNHFLYLINSSAPTNIIIEVKDQGLIALRNIVVNISKYYPDINKFIQVESRITDDNGQFVAKLIENDAKYMFEFYDINGKFLKVSPSIIISCKVTVGCTVPFVIETSATEFDEFTNLSDYSYEFTFNNATNVFRYAWNDLTGESAITRLEVTRILLNGSAIVCNTTSASNLAVLSCSVGSQRASYKGSAFRLGEDGNERRIAVLNIKVGDIAGTFGIEGLLWVFILLFTCIGIGVFNPAISAALYGVGFIVFGLVGIISMPIEVFFANTILVVVFVWAIRT